VREIERTSLKGEREGTSLEGRIERTSLKGEREGTSLEGRIERTSLEGERERTSLEVEEKGPLSRGKEKGSFSRKKDLKNEICTTRTRALPYCMKFLEK